MNRSCYALVALLALIACNRQETLAPPAPQRPSILLVTLDTTRADAIGTHTPAFNALANRGRRFQQAYATVPQTLPSHASMMTGLYPAGHGVHENARFLAPTQPLLAEKLREAGYHTAAFVSAFAVARRFGLGRGFEVYDEDFGDERAERTAKETTDRALKYLDGAAAGPLFLWVHYYDPHYPYTPPEPYRTRFANDPYRGEVASMDEQLGRIVAAFEKRGSSAIVVVADHGEGLGEHGEQQHGNLLYQSTMHVPMVMVGPGFKPGTTSTPVSTRRIFHTILDWAGLGTDHTLRTSSNEVVLGEAMMPFLQYGWQPQVMAIENTTKAIHAGAIEIYNVAADPAEHNDLAANADLSRAVRKSLNEYPIPLLTQATTGATLDEEARRQLASLGYVTADVKPIVRKDAPRPVDMTSLFPILEKASGLFVREQYAATIPFFEQIRAKDPYNLDAALRLAIAHSALGHEQQALEAFRHAESLAPDSPDVRTYLALHYAKGKEWQRAVPMLERIVHDEPDRLPPIEALAVIRERQGRIAESVQLRVKIHTMRAASGPELARLATMQMELGQTEPAIESFEKAQALQGNAFRQHLELGVLYLAAGKLEQARQELDRVARNDPAWSMALFKRAQVSVLLHESDQAERIAAAKANADETTRMLIEREKLFQ